jgi:hypothetical protein
MSEPIQRSAAITFFPEDLIPMSSSVTLSSASRNM